MKSLADIAFIILDLDGTLYGIEDVIQTVYRNQVAFLSAKLGYTQTETEELFARNGVFPIISGASKSATELFAKMGLDIEEWSAYRNEHFDVKAIQREKAVDERILRQLIGSRDTVLLSSNSLLTIQSILAHLGISQDCFTEILCSDNFSDTKCFSKKTAIQHLSTKYHVPLYAMISIGDRFLTDIQPMIELGGHGVLVHSPQSLQKVAADLKNGMLKTCSDYTFYD